MQDPTLEGYLQMQLDAELGAAVRQLPDGMGLVHYDGLVNSYWFVAKIRRHEVYYETHGRGNTPKEAIVNALEAEAVDGSG